MGGNSGIFKAHRSMSPKHIYTRLLLHKVQKFSITSYVWFCWISDCWSLWVFWIICSPWLWIDNLLTFGLLRSYSNGRPEHAAFSWRTCSWDPRGEYPSVPTPLCSTPARSREHRRLCSVHSAYSALSLLTAHEQIMLLIFIKVSMCMILCLESNRLGYMHPKGHRDWAQILRVSEHGSN